MAQTTHAHVLILGSGCAGWTAAIYAARAELKPVLISGSTPGGQLATTTEVENYPGFEKGIMGPELMEIMQKQAERFGTRTEYGLVTKADLSTRPFRLTTDADADFTCDALIIATGAAPRMLGLPAEQQLLGHGLSTCATCDGAFFKGKDIIVVGGGDSAMEESLYLSRLVRKVTLVHRRHEFRASKIMQERVLKNDKIDIKWNRQVVEVFDPAQGKVTGARLEATDNGVVEDLAVDAVFLAIGHEPNTALFKGQLDLDPNGYLLVHDGTKTKIPGVFAAGDCVDHVYRQAVTAAGMGCMAALDAERWLGAQECA